MDETNTNIIYTGNGGDTLNPNYTGAYYYIDNASVVICDSINGFLEIGFNNSITIIPIGYSGIYKINSKNGVLENVSVNNLWGQSILSLTKNSSNEFLLDLTSATNGIYLITIQTNEGVITKKFFHSY